MKDQLIFQAVFLVAVFVAYLGLNYLFGLFLGWLWRWVDDPLLDFIQAVGRVAINVLAIAGLACGEYLHFTGRLF